MSLGKLVTAAILIALALIADALFFGVFIVDEPALEIINTTGTIVAG